MADGIYEWAPQQAAAAAGAAAADGERVVKPVQFAKGKRSAVIRDRVVGHHYVDHRCVPAPAGALTMSLKGSNRASYFNLLPPGSADGSAMAQGELIDNRFDGLLPDDGGIYAIRVFMYRAAAPQRGELEFPRCRSASLGRAAQAGFGHDGCGAARHPLSAPARPCGRRPASLDSKARQCGSSWCGAVSMARRRWNCAGTAPGSGASSSSRASRGGRYAGGDATFTAARSRSRDWSTSSLNRWCLVADGAAPAGGCGAALLGGERAASRCSSSSGSRSRWCSAAGGPAQGARGARSRCGAGRGPAGPGAAWPGWWTSCLYGWRMPPSANPTPGRHCRRAPSRHRLLIAAPLARWARAWKEWQAISRQESGTGNPGRIGR